MKQYLANINIPLMAMLLAGHLAFSQVESDAAATEAVEVSSLILKAKNYGDSIVLRWTPDNANDWLRANQYGYRISRAEIDTTKDAALAFELLDTVRVEDLEEWKAYVLANPDQKYVAAAMQCIHGDPVADKPAQGLPNFILKQDMLANRFGFTLFSCDLSVIAANKSALRYSDRNFEKGKNYYYRVDPLIPKSRSKIGEGFIIVDSDEVQVPKPLVISKREEEARVVLSWNREEAASEYTAYNIERSRDGQSFTRLNDIPYIHPIDEEENFYTPYYSYRDSLPGNYQPHYYRVSGITAFGDQGPWSEVIMAQGVDRTPPRAPGMGQVEYTDDGNLHISWDYSNPGESLLGVNLLYSYDLDKPFYLLNQEYLEEGAQRYTHEKPNPFLSHFYKIEAVDTAGNIATSIPFKGYIIDTIPPAQPQGLTAVADTNGLVFMSWDKNPEPDVIGYKIFFANDLSHEFGLKTGHAVEATRYLDTIALNSFTEVAYYKIMAVDYSFNYSKHSEIFELKRPDIFPPSAPVFNDYEVRESSIYVQWAPSHSEDVVSHNLYRRTEGTDWQLVEAFDPGINSYEDQGVKPRTEYDYKILALDDAGLFSKTVKPIRLTSRQAIIPPVSNLKAQYDEESKSVNLTWDYDTTLDDPYSFIIYKAIGEQGYTRLKVEKEGVKKVKDNRVKSGSTYKYAVKISCQDGRKSKFSDVVNFTPN